MPDGLWTDSTQNLVISSGGVLQNDFKGPWSRSQLDVDDELETTGELPSFVAWLQDIECGQMAHVVAFTPITTDAEYVLPIDAFWRVVCHVILSRLPDRALSEAWESLNEMLNFYLYESQPHLITDGDREIKATIVESVPRSAFNFDE